MVYHLCLTFLIINKNHVGVAMLAHQLALLASDKLYLIIEPVTLTDYPATTLQLHVSHSQDGDTLIFGT